MTEDEKKFMMALSRGFLMMMGRQSESEPAQVGMTKGGDYWWETQ